MYLLFVFIILFIFEVLMFFSLLVLLKKFLFIVLFMKLKNDVVIEIVFKKLFIFLCFLM